MLPVGRGGPDLFENTRNHTNDTKNARAHSVLSIKTVKAHPDAVEEPGCSSVEKKTNSTNGVGRTGSTVVILDVVPVVGGMAMGATFYPTAE